MQTHIVLLLILSFIGCVQSQNWLGNYTASSSCSTILCCCLSGQVVVTTVSTNTISFTTGLSGGVLCGYAPSYTINMSTPTTYVSGLTITPYTLTFMLSPDSLTINVTSTQGSSCGGTLTKNIPATTTAATTTVATATAATTLSTAASSFANSISQSKIWLLVIMALIGLMRSV